MIYYSPSAHAFFHDQIRAPADALEISAARHHDLIDGQACGGIIVAGSDGYPHLVPTGKPTIADRRAAAVRRVKREATRRIEAISPVWRQITDQRLPSAAGTSRFKAIDAIRAASDHIEAEIATANSAKLAALDLANHPFWPAD